jgi:cell division protease FtsH
MDKRLQLSIWYLILSLILMLWVQNKFAGARQVELKYSDFKKAVAARQVSDIAIGKERVQGDITPEAVKQFAPVRQTVAPLTAKQPKYTFTTVRVDDPDLSKDLQAAQVSYAGTVESTFLGNVLSWLLPMLIMIAVWQFLLRRMGAAGQGLLSIGKSKPRLYVESEVKLDFGNVAGIDEAVDELREVVAFLKTPGQFTRLVAVCPRGYCWLARPAPARHCGARDGGRGRSAVL